MGNSSRNNVVIGRKKSENGANMKLRLQVLRGQEAGRPERRSYWRRIGAW
jgi:hypothetical protein